MTYQIRVGVIEEQILEYQNEIQYAQSLDELIQINHKLQECINEIHRLKLLERVSDHYDEEQYE